MRMGANMLEQIRYLIEEGGNTPTQEKPLTVTLREGEVGVAAEVWAYDSLGIALHGLTVGGDHCDASLETLAQTISERVTYLSERLALVECDLDRQQVQMRSAPPLIRDETIEFYEGQLTGQSESAQSGVVRMRLVRYRQKKGQKRRARVPIMLTHDMFQHLVTDLATIATGQP